jgi:hypothetical protein
LSDFREHMELAAAVLRIPSATEGTVVECGRYMGGSTSNLSLVCATTGRKLIIFDSFAGLPEPQEYDRWHHADRRRTQGSQQSQQQHACSSPSHRLIKQARSQQTVQDTPRNGTPPSPKPCSSFFLPGCIRRGCGISGVLPGFRHPAVVRVQPMPPDQCRGTLRRSSAGVVASPGWKASIMTSPILAEKATGRALEFRRPMLWVRRYSLAGAGISRWQ